MMEPSTPAPTPILRTLASRALPLLAATLLLAPLLTPAAFAEPPTLPTSEEGEFADSVRVTEVLLDALVTDRDGNVVVGLNPDDFVVAEEGVAVDLEAAYFYSNLEIVDAPTAAASGAAPGTSPSDRYFILFFHDQRRGLGSLAKQQLLAARESKEWIANGRELSDYVAVASFGSRLEIHQDFTQSTSALQRAVDAAAISKRESKEWSTRRGSEQEGVPSLFDNLPKAKEIGRRSRDIADALVLLAEAAQPIVGRKNLMLFTAGIGTIDPFGRYNPGDRDIERIKESFNTSNIAAYPIETLQTGSEHPLRNALNEIADATSGQLYYNFTQFSTPMDAIAEANTGYYLLAYSSEGKSEDDYREVDVTLRNPEFKIAVRRGYRLTGGETNQK